MADEKPHEYQLVAFTIGDQEFGMDINQVREIIRLVQITHLPKAPVFIEGAVNLRGQVLAVVDLAKRIGLKAKERGSTTRIIVVDVGDNTVGMIVDSVSEVLRLSSNCMEEVPSLVNTEVPEHYIRGIVKLKDRLLVFLDLNMIITPDEFSHVERHVKAVAV
ncbi:MAG: chemotaxis protein CheW [Candidatus Omnitrophota bacterium]